MLKQKLPIIASAVALFAVLVFGVFGVLASYSGESWVGLPFLQAVPSPTPTLKAGQEVELTGKVEAIAPDSWTVGGYQFLVDTGTDIEHGIVVGDLVKVEAIALADGTYLAKEIDLVNEKSPTPLPSKTAGPSATATLTKTPAPSKTPEPSKTATLTKTAGPSKTPKPVEMEFKGLVESISGDTWVVNGITFTVTLKTEIEGHPQVGDMVKVEAIKKSDGTIIAKQIETIGAKVGNDQGEDEDDDDDDDQGVQATPITKTLVPGTNPTLRPTATGTSREHDD